MQEELQQGWIREVTGGLPALRQQYRLCAVGKLGLVQASGRIARPVVDSSVSAVTENTVLPNRSCNPTLAHLRQCLCVGAAPEDFTALVLDVSKAHRRIKIRPEDQGLLCFHRRAVSVSDPQLWGEGLQLLPRTRCWPSLSTSASHHLRESWPFDLC